ETFVLHLARRFSAIGELTLDEHLYADLGISGSDAVEFYETIEERFAIDLRPVTEFSVQSGPKWLAKARDKKIGRDPTLRELCSFIAEGR
ncbi:MAG TPA: hypothetical protein VJT70_02845, partial [Sphingomicrobium sp.]|nr:hypothetical protein [Sphingomicrobium sp.]